MKDAIMAEVTFTFKKTIWYHLLVRFPFMLGLLKGKKLMVVGNNKIVIKGSDLLVNLKRGGNNSDIIVG